MKKVEDIIEKLKTVYDPEFPLVDIYTLWLIYDINLYEEKSLVHILLSFTTPSCPMADMIVAMIRTAILELYPDFEVEIEITFDPMWTMDKIKDPDLKRMFE